MKRLATLTLEFIRITGCNAINPTALKGNRKEDLCPGSADKSPGNYDIHNHLIASVYPKPSEKTAARSAPAPAMNEARWRCLPTRLSKSQPNAIVNAIIQYTCGAFQRPSP